MIAYLSGFDSEKFYEKGTKLGLKHHLYSFYSFSRGREKRQLKDRWTPDTKIFIDSGGYSARVKGVKINIYEYIDFLNINAPYITIAANLDTSNPEETLANQKLLIEKTRGVKILPVYHYSDYISPKYRGLLDEYIRDFDYVGIGGTAGTHTPKKVLDKFLSYVFSKTKDKVKAHGFGNTSERIVTKFPFYSVDSTSWLVGAKYAHTVSRIGKQFSYNDKEGVIGGNVPFELIGRKAHYLKRVEYDLLYWVEYEKRITELWKARGVVWKD